MSFVILKPQIERETDKAILVKISEANGQLSLTGDEVEPKTADVWIPKSVVNNDYKKLDQLHIKEWFYEKEIAEKFK